MTPTLPFPKTFNPASKTSASEVEFPVAEDTYSRSSIARAEHLGLVGRPVLPTWRAEIGRLNGGISWALSSKIALHPLLCHVTCFKGRKWKRGADNLTENSSNAGRPISRTQTRSSPHMTNFILA